MPGRKINKLNEIEKNINNKYMQMGRKTLETIVVPPLKLRNVLIKQNYINNFTY